MSGWDQHNDQDEQDPEIRWLLACTIIAALLLLFWVISPRLS